MNKKREGMILITRLKTSNSGNQGLSHELIGLFQRVNHGRPFGTLERVPVFLTRYGIADVGGSSHTAVEKFESLVEELVVLTRKMPLPHASFSVEQPHLLIFP